MVIQHTKVELAFLDSWATGEADWDDGRASGQVVTEGPETAWPHWLAATGYLLRVEADPAPDRAMAED